MQPDKPGWYWARMYGDPPEAIEVRGFPNGLWFESLVGGGPIDLPGITWLSGPIPTPCELARLRVGAELADAFEAASLQSVTGEPDYQSPRLMKARIAYVEACKAAATEPR